MIEHAMKRMAQATDDDARREVFRSFALAVLQLAQKQWKPKPKKRKPRKVPAGPYKQPGPTMGTATSTKAAAANKPRRPTQRDKIEKLLIQRGQHGATADEIEVAMGYPSGTVCPRLRELADRHRAKQTDQVRTTRRGRDAFVWVAI